MTILLILSIIGFSLLPMNIKKIKGGESPIIALSSAIILLYIFAITGLLNFGVYLVFLAGLIALPATYALQRKSIKDFLSKIYDPGYAIFIVLVIILYPICKPIVTGAWDEYSHWALVVRNMLLTGAMPQPDGAVLYITYPPATVLYQYFFMKVSGGTEGMMYYAQALLLAASLCALTKGASYKKPLLLIMSIILPIVVMVKFSVHNIFNIFPDTLMSVMAAAAFAIFYKSERKMGDMYKLLPILFALTLVRANSIVFSAFAIFLVIVVLKSDKKIKETKLGVLYIIAATAVSYLSWYLYLKIIGAESTVGGMDGFFPIDTERLIKILDAFKSALFFNELGTVYQPLYLASSAIAFAFMAAVLVFIINFMLKYSYSERRKFKSLSISLFVLFAGYCAVVILGYQYLFTYSEAVSLASYNRYMSSYFIFWIIIMCFVIANLIASGAFLTKGKKAVATALLLAVIIAIAGLTNPTMLNIIGGRRLENVYEEEAVSCAKEIQDAVGTEAKVYMIFQKSRGYVFMGTRYQLGTNLTNLGTWSLGEPYSDADTWTVDISPEDLLERLYNQNYEYVYVAGGGDEQLWENYGTLFDAPDSGSTVFQVTEDSDAPLKAVN